MSYDGTNACPACHHRAVGTPWGEITQREHLNNADVLGLGEECLKEYYEIHYDKGFLVFDFKGADCRDCDYEIPAFKMTYPIPEPETT